MTRIVLNGRFLCQPMTGVQRYALHTVLALDRLLGQDRSLRESLNITLATPKGAPAPLLQHIQVRSQGRSRGHAWEQWTLPRLAAGAHLVNFNYSGPLFKRDQLITVHDATVAAMPQAFGWRYRWVHRAMVAWLKDRVHTVMTVSAFSRDELAQRMGVRDALVGTEGWEHVCAADDAAAARAVLHKHGLTSGGYVLAAGSVKPNKNFEVIDRALQRLGGRLKLPVAIAGARDRSVFRHSDPGANVRLLGYVDDAELAQLYCHAAWFVFPSLYEGFGLPAIEAMGNGCPVIAANAASIPEVCGDAALYFDPHDAQGLARLLERAANEPGLQDTMRERGLQRAAKFSWLTNARLLARHLMGLHAVAVPATASNVVPAK
jgi:glycosyltransferase involved in cell wall biosynthesis